MTGELRFAWLFRSALGLMLMIGLFSMPSMSMRAGSMVMTSEAGTLFENVSAGHGHKAPTPCCNDATGSLVMTCGMLIPHFAFAILFAGTQRVALSPLSVPITYRETVTPPPKI